MATKPNVQKEEQEAILLPAELPHSPIGHPDTMMSAESVRKAVQEFKVRPSDIIVTTFAKTGTTLITWLCHLLRTRGEFDINSIETMYEVVPWPTLSYDIGYDPNVDGSQFYPRVFKSHLRMASVFRGCKYIVSIRDPARTALSFYNFFRNKEVPVAMEKHVSSFLMETPFVQGREGRASLWDYYREYHILRDCPAVLVVPYEDLVQNLPAYIRIMAQFMGLDHIDSPLVAKVAAMSTKEYMAQHMNKFDEPYERAKQLGRVGDLSQLKPGAKIALASHPQQFNAEARQFLVDQWNQTMRPLGYSDYPAFCAEFRKRNQARFNVTY